mgnify:CR=1 FL=1
MEVGALTEAELATNAATWEHINQVQHLLAKVIRDLQARSLLHDKSKLELPEASYFAEFTPKLRTLTYGSAEYKACLKELDYALKHHYAVNSHHPEHYSNGIAGMTLMDLVEMLADWKAATMRHADGDLAKSLQINRERFGINDQLAGILENTARTLGWVQ